MRDNADLKRMALLGIVGAVVAVVVPWELARIFFALPLALFLPGYAIVAAAFARAPVNRPQELTMAVAVSLAVLALGGLLLTYVPGGITTASWAIFLLAVILVACRAAALRRRQSGGEESSRPTGRPALRGLRGPDVAVAAAAVALVVGALVLAFTPLSAEKATGYTALWMLPGTGDQSGRLLVGVQSSQHGPLRYRLEVHAPRLGREVEFALAPGEERVASLRLPPPSRAKERVEATLYRLDRPTVVYRKVALWLPIGAAG